MVMVWPGSTRRSKKPQVQLLLLLYATGCFLLPMSRHDSVTAAAVPFSFNFDFSSTSSYHLDDLRFEGDAALNGDLVDLTCKTPGQSGTNNCTGRMSYNHPVRLYDNVTGEVASFSTHFTFAINPYQGGNGSGDGMAFFLSGYPSRLPLGSGGGYLGLDDGKTALGPNRYVAVEFDTFSNTWDPIGTKDHIGIVISSVRSSSNTTSMGSSNLDGTMMANISFNCTTKMLIASLQFDKRPYLQPVQVSMQLPDDITSLLPPEVAVGFSAAGTSFKFHRILFWSFRSTLARTSQGIKGSGNMDATVIIGGAILSVIVIWFTLSWFMWKRAGISFGKRAGLGEFRRFKYHRLVEATCNFAPKNKLGEGKFGVVYKGILKKHKGEPDQVAVKKIKKCATGEACDFLSELKASSRTSHKNLVRLKGCCCSRIKWKLFDFMFCRQRNNTDLFIIYELVPNGSLDDHLKKDMREQNVLSWETRYEIVKGIASGLCYLHHECKPYILHRDIKPENILLEADFSPKLTDFGLSRIAGQNNTIASTMAIGTEKYMDPLCMKDGKVKYTRTSDVYSFGVVLLEIACTRKTPWLVWRMYRQSGLEKFLDDAADVKLNGAFNRMQMKQVVVLGLWCCFANYAQRPSMEDAVKVLGNDTPLLQRGMWILKHDMEWPDEQTSLWGYLSDYAQRPSTEDATQVVLGNDKPLLQGGKWILA